MTPFTLQIAQEQIDDLVTRLARTRMPDRTPGPDWSFGTDPDWLTDLVAYWRDAFDWRAQEAALNPFSQFRMHLHGIDVHVIRAEGRGPAPTPLLLLHGWPGSVFEFLDILPILTIPPATEAIRPIASPSSRHRCRASACLSSPDKCGSALRKWQRFLPI